MRDRRVRDLGIAGAAGLVAGWAWGLVFPINKALWTSSYVVFTAGFACVMLALCIWVIDIRQLRGWTKPFVIYGVNPIVAFVGRITRQKGVPHLLRAGLEFDPGLQIVLLAGAADTPELKAETDEAIERLTATRDGVFVVSEMLPREDVRQVLTHAVAFLCPSVYEPLGIVNLEAMACETAVVASRVGGIPEVVVDGETGLLVEYDEKDPRGFEKGLADAVNRLAGDRELTAYTRGEIDRGSRGVGVVSVPPPGREEPSRRTLETSTAPSPYSGWKYSPTRG